MTKETSPVSGRDTLGQRYVDELWESLEPACQLLSEVDQGLHPELVESAQRKFAASLESVRRGNVSSQ